MIRVRYHIFLKKLKIKAKVRTSNKFFNFDKNNTIKIILFNVGERK